MTIRILHVTRSPGNAKSLPETGRVSYSFCIHIHSFSDCSEVKDCIITYTAKGETPPPTEDLIQEISSHIILLFLHCIKCFDIYDMDEKNTSATLQREPQKT